MSSPASEKRASASLAEYFQATCLFSDSELEAIVNSFVRHDVEKGEQLFAQGDICRGVFYVERGCFKVSTVDERLHESILYFGTEGWWLSDLDSLMGQSVSLYGAVALERGEVQKIERERFLDLLERYPKFKDGHLQLLRRSYAAILERFGQMRSRSAEDRYLELMRVQAQIAQRVAQQDLAAYLGIEPQSLSRLRRRLADRARRS